MAPAPKPKDIPEGFAASSDKKRLQCLLCTANSPAGNDVWMDWSSHRGHVTSKKHEQAKERDAAQRIHVTQLHQNQQDDLARQREAAMQFSALQDVQIPADDRPAHRVQSAAETELWQGMSADPQGAGFDLGSADDPLQPDTLLGLWNAETMGHDSAVDEGPTAVDEDYTDEFLAEIMQNAGKSITRTRRTVP